MFYAGAATLHQVKLLKKQRQEARAEWNMSGAMWPCGKSYGPGWDFFSFRFSFSFFNSPVKVSAAILIDGHKLQLNTFFICLLSVAVAVLASPHFRGVRLDSVKLK